MTDQLKVEYHSSVGKRSHVKNGNRTAVPSFFRSHTKRYVMRRLATQAHSNRGYQPRSNGGGAFNNAR